MTRRVHIVRVPVDKSLKIDQCSAFSGLAGQCVGVAGRSGRAVLCGLPVVVDLEMNSAVTRRVPSRSAGSAIVGDDSWVVDVEGKIVECCAVPSGSVGRIIDC